MCLSTFYFDLTGVQIVVEETRTRGNNELYNHRMDQENIQSLTAELRDPHPFITWGVNCPVTSKPFKVRTVGAVEVLCG